MLLDENVADGVEVTVDAAVCTEEPVTVCVVVVVGPIELEGVCEDDAVPEILSDDDGVRDAVIDGVPLKDAV